MSSIRLFIKYLWWTYVVSSFARDTKWCQLVCVAWVCVSIVSTTDKLTREWMKTFLYCSDTQPFSSPHIQSATLKYCYCMAKAIEACSIICSLFVSSCSLAADKRERIQTYYIIIIVVIIMIIIIIVHNTFDKIIPLIYIMYWHCGMCGMWTRPDNGVWVSEWMWLFGLWIVGKSCR